MIYLIAGASHAGKTLLAQRLLETYHYPCLSIDHLKMGLIRAGYTALTPEDDEELTDYLWPVVREMIKTAIENRQNLIIEGSYIPFDWQADFDDDYRQHIRYTCLILSEGYIRAHMDDILQYANVVETRLDDSYCTAEWLIETHGRTLARCREHGLPYHLIEDKYETDFFMEF